MKDSRISVWTNTTSHATGSTTNTGPTIDLFASGVPVGGSYNGTELYGIGVEIIQTCTSGTAQVSVWEWEVSADDSTWRKGGFIASNAMTATGVVKKRRSSLQTPYRYARLFVTNTGTGESTSVAYTEDVGPLPGTNAAPLA